MKKVLLFSSLKKPKEIIELSIESWVNLVESKKFTFEILLFDDSYDETSSKFIKEIESDNKKINLINFRIDSKDNYQGDHLWNNQQIDRVSEIKNNAILYALENDFDYLFLVDSDLVLNHKTLENLIYQKKDFIFEVFWTLFHGERFYKPNAWDYHSWAYYDENTILQLAQNGVYEVGGGGACTLLSKEILSKGLTFNRLKSLNFNGEDRHFCTRAQSLGYGVFVDTYYPAYHIFNVNQINEAKIWYREGAKPEYFKKWLNEKWKKKVKQNFSKKQSFIEKIRNFQYEVRREIFKSYIKNFK